MSFSIVSSSPGVVRLTIQGPLDNATLYLLRLELANLIRQRPTRVELSFGHPFFVTDSSKGLLLSFLERLRAHGVLLFLHNPGGRAVEVVDSPPIRRLLRARLDSLGVP
jgi:hypothetical protein